MTKTIECSDCDGRGAFSRNYSRSVWPSDPDSQACSNCHGTGKLVTEVPLIVPGEEIVSVREITGEDGRVRELVTVKELGTNTSEWGVENPNRSTWRCRAGSTRRASTKPTGLANQLKKGYGHKLGIVTDGTTFRYV